MRASPRRRPSTGTVTSPLAGFGMGRGLLVAGLLVPSARRDEGVGTTRWNEEAVYSPSAASPRTSPPPAACTRGVTSTSCTLTRSG